MGATGFWTAVLVAALVVGLLGAAMEVLLLRRLYRSPENAVQSIPLLRLLSTSAENLQNRAERLAIQLNEMPAVATAEAMEDTAYLGGGSVPTQQLPTWCVAITPAEGSVDQLARQLRTGTIPVFGRIHLDRLLLDLRAVFVQQDMEILEAIRAIASEQAAAEEPAFPALGTRNSRWPRSSAAVNAADMPRSLKEPVGLQASFLARTRARPKWRASRGSSSRGVQPSPRVTGSAPGASGSTGW